MIVAGRLAPRALFGLVALACAAALATALATQHLLGMQPCAWCVLQRLVFAVIGVVALAAALGRGAPLRRAGAGLVGLLALAGIAAALWQHFVAASSSSCDLTLADRIMSGLGLDLAWPEVFAAFASCADARVNLLGVPYEFFSLALFVAIAAAAVLAWRAAARAR